jgi:biofilm PGA synthesis N-glycosyltransferase PgaC
LNVLEIVAAGALILLAYTYFGYPLLLGLLARLFPWRPHPDPTWEPTVTMCVAAYNAAAYIEAKLQSLVGQDYPADKLEILVYSDGSTDGTESAVAVWAQRDPRIHLIVGVTRQGKPTALNRMREQATGEVLVITDARQPVDPGALRALLSLLAAPEVGCVTGNLVLDGAEGSGVYWRYENWIRKQESRFSSLVGVTGALAALRRRDLGRFRWIWCWTICGSPCRRACAAPACCWPKAPSSTTWPFPTIASSAARREPWPATTSSFRACLACCCRW